MPTAKKMEVKWVDDPTVDLTGMDISKPADAAKLMSKLTKDSYVENFILLCLDAKRELIGYKIVSTGTHVMTLVPVADIIRESILSGASYIIIGHNHPADDVTPSDPDLICTKDIIKIGILTQIGVLDHIIVSGDKFTSMRGTKGYIWQEAKRDAMVKYYIENKAIANREQNARN